MIFLWFFIEAKGMNMFINFRPYGPYFVCCVVWAIEYGLHLYRATHVQNEDGSVVLLSASNPRQRNAIAKRLLTPSKEGSLGGAAKKVHVHVQCILYMYSNRSRLSTPDSNLHYKNYFYSTCKLGSPLYHSSSYWIFSLSCLLSAFMFTDINPHVVVKYWF